jgi:hypothetical protein
MGKRLFGLLPGGHEARLSALDDQFAPDLT